MFTYGTTGVPSFIFSEVTGFLNSTGNPATSAAFQAGLGTGIHQLNRIQSAGYDFSVSRTPVNQFGQLSSIDRIILNSPVASLNFNYIQSSLWNENKLGLVCDGTVGTLSGILNKASDEKNYFLLTVPQGQDAIANTASDSNTFVMGIGNGFVTSYSSQGSVGNFPTASINVEGLNMSFQNTRSGITPALNPVNGRVISNSNTNGNFPFRYIIPVAQQEIGTGNLSVSALRPGDITVTILKRDAEGEGTLVNATGTYDVPGALITDAKIQSYNIGFDLSREMIQQLGSRFAISREPNFPVTINASVEAIVGDLTTGNLSDIINCDDAYDITVKLNKPLTCTDFSNVTLAQYNVRNAKIDRVSYSDSIGANRNVTLNFSSEIGGPSETKAGLFVSGVYSA
jgi:hypothetical protein